MSRQQQTLTSDASLINSLLSSLPRAEYQHLLAGLEPVTLKFGEVLHEPGAPIPYAYFPVDCVIALLVMLPGHHPLKVGLVGHEGMVGSPLALGVLSSSRRALVQGSGTAMRMKSSFFRKEILRSKALRQAVFRFKHALIGQIAQSAACKQVHSLGARLARYLTMTCDSARSKEVRLTHNFMAGMLGVRRSSVTIALGTLEKRKLIKCSRGNIAILDQRRLSAASCECYQIIKRLYDESAHADG